MFDFEPFKHDRGIHWSCPIKSKSQVCYDHVSQSFENVFTSREYYIIKYASWGTYAVALKGEDKYTLPNKTTFDTLPEAVEALELLLITV